jgi:hypothetical protein
MNLMRRLVQLGMRCIGLLIVLAAACTPSAPSPTPTPNPPQNQYEKWVRANTVLSTVGAFAEGSFLACMLDAYMQGLPADQSRRQCDTQLLEDNDKGWGGPFGDIGHPEMFDPGKITADCSSGDPNIAGSYGEARKPGNGTYSWGGNANEYRQLTKEESEKRKDQAIAEADKARDKWLEAVREEAKAIDDLKAAEKTGDQKKIDEAKENLEAAEKKTEAASQKADVARGEAKGDPNKKPLPNTRPATVSQCEEALNEARELLRECNRTAWQDFRCQQLQAKLGDCPDPAYILVDPEQGYTCGVKPDAETLKALQEAWVARCEELKRFDPSGPNPCEPPKFDESELIAHGKTGDVCNDPHAYVDPDNNDCFATFEVKPFGEINPQQLAVWGLNNLGGPIIVLTSTTPEPPQPGPQPRPSPP